MKNSVMTFWEWYDLNINTDYVILTIFTYFIIAYIFSRYEK